MKTAFKYLLRFKALEWVAALQTLANVHCELHREQSLESGLDPLKLQTVYPNFKFRV